MRRVSHRRDRWGTGTAGRGDHDQPHLRRLDAEDERGPASMLRYCRVRNQQRDICRVADAHSGSYGERLTLTSWTDGDAKLAPLMDLGGCSSQVASGRNYEVSAWYKSDYDVFFTLFKRNAIGQWTYWTHGPRIAPASEWTRAAWISPTPPVDASAVSFGVTIDSVGTLTTDDYSFVDTPDRPPPAQPGATN